MDHARTAYEIASRARDHHARQVFATARVQKAIEERATGGYRDLRLVQKQPFDLSRSTSARALEAWLDANKYRYAWSATSPVADPLLSSLSEDYPELAIFW